MTHFEPLNQISGGLPDPYAQSEFYAGTLFKRLIAWGLDMVFVLLITLLFCVFTFGIGFFIFVPMFAVFKFIYRFLTLSTRSSTWGMRIMAIEYRRSDGEKFDGMTALLHTIGTAISFGTGVQIASIIAMILTPKGQGLIDLVLGSAMINSPSYRS